MARPGDFPAGVKTALGASGFLTPSGEIDDRHSRPAGGKPSRFPIFQGDTVKHLHDDLATALVSATLCLAAASLFVVVFAGVA